jgi:hypothetical protein
VISGEAGEAGEAGERGEAATRPAEWGAAASDFLCGTRRERTKGGERTRGDGSGGLPSLRGRAEIFSGARALSFRDEVDRAEQRSSIRASLLGRAIRPFSYALASVEIDRAGLTNTG